MNDYEEEKFKIIYLFYTIKTYISLFIVIILIFIFTIPVLLLSILFDKNGNIYLFFTRLFIKIFFFLNFIIIDNKIDLKNHKDLKKEKRIIYVINHSSLIDGLLLFLMPGKIRCMVNDMYIKMPIFGLGMRMMGNIGVEKKGEGSFLDQYYKALELLKKNYPLVIFPEGTRSRDSNIGKFYNSAFMLALEAKCDIIPVVFDTWNILRPGSFIIRDNNIVIKLLDRVKYNDIIDYDYKTVSKIVKYKILTELLKKREENRKIKKYYRNSKKFLEIDYKMKKENEKLKKMIPNKFI